MKHIVLSISALCALAAVAVDTANETPEQRAARIAARNERVMKNAGGFIVRPGTGKVVIASCKGAADLTLFSAEIADMKEKTKIAIVPIDLEDAVFSLPGARALMESVSADIACFFIDDPAYPLSLYAPEANWAVVNVAKLKADNPTADRLALRCRKMLARAMTFALGASFRGNLASPMQTVTDLNALDAMAVDRISIFDYNNILQHLPKIGVSPTRKTTYKAACREGWAPQPTNEYQKAIWEQVHSIPTKPLKIEFDPKTDTK